MEAFKNGDMVCHPMYLSSDVTFSIATQLIDVDAEIIILFDRLGLRIMTSTVIILRFSTSRNVQVKLKVQKAPRSND